MAIAARHAVARNTVAGRHLSAEGRAGGGVAFLENLGWDDRGVTPQDRDGKEGPMTPYHDGIGLQAGCDSQIPMRENPENGTAGEGSQARSGAWGRSPGSHCFAPGIVHCSSCHLLVSCGRPMRSVGIRDRAGCHARGQAKFTTGLGGASWHRTKLQSGTHGPVRLALSEKGRRRLARTASGGFINICESLP